MKQEEIYLTNAYLKEWDAEIIEINENQEIVLDKTAFYPGGGGQLNDLGKIIRKEDNAEFEVIHVERLNEKIVHKVDRGGLQLGDKITCFLNWERRYRMMRMHTAAHILSGVIEKETGALISGNQLGLDKSRIDFDLDFFNKEKMKFFVDKANEIVQKDLDVKISFLPYDVAIKQEELFKLLKGFNKKIDQIRIIEIENFQKQADGGTHVAKTKEVGKIIFLGAENKGAKRRRIYFTLED